MTPHPEGGHLSSCEAQHAPEMYREELERTNEEKQPGWASMLRRRIQDSEGIYFLKCTEGCPHRERWTARGRELAEEHGW